jgi:hypothetical protein
MQRPSRAIKFGILFLSVAGAFAVAQSALADAVEPSSVAVAGFDFRDTSGEVVDQSADHDARLEAVGVALRNGLSKHQRIRLVPLACQRHECTARTSGLEALSRQARKASARYLLIGEVHKMSTLVGWMKFAVLDLNDNKPTCDRFLTYRGDTDEAWRRAAEFAVRDIEKHCIP